MSNKELMDLIDYEIEETEIKKIKLIKKKIVKIKLQKNLYQTREKKVIVVVSQIKKKENHL